METHIQRYSVAPTEIKLEKASLWSQEISKQGCVFKGSLLLGSQPVDYPCESIGVGMWGRFWTLSILRDPKRQRKFKPVDGFIAPVRESQSTHSCSFINQQTQTSMVFSNTIGQYITHTNYLWALAKKSFKETNGSPAVSPHWTHILPVCNYPEETTVLPKNETVK